MFEKVINSKLFQYIMTVTIAILTVILTQGLVAKREVAKSVKEEISKKATIEYVDTQDNAIKESVSILREDLNGSVIQIKDDLREIRNYIYDKNK